MLVLDVGRVVVRFVDGSEKSNYILRSYMVIVNKVRIMI